MKRGLLFLLLVLLTAGLVHLTHRTPAPPTGDAATAEAPASKMRLPGNRRLTGVTALAAAGERVLIGDSAGRVRLHPEGRWWAAHEGAVRRVWSLPDGGVATAGADGSVGLWSADGALRTRLRLPAAHLNDAAPHDATVYVAADRGTVARLCDPTPCWVHMGVHGAAAYAVAFAPAGDRLATGGMDGQIALRSPSTGEPLATWRNGDGWVTALAWTDEGLWAGDNSGRVTFRAGALPDAEPVVYTVASRPVVALLPLPGAVLVGADDGRLVPLDRTRRNPGAAVETGSPVRALATAGDTVYTGGADGHVRRYTWSPAGLTPAGTLEDGDPAWPDPAPSAP